MKLFKITPAVFLLTAILFSSAAFAQKNYFQDAELAFNGESYYSAIEMYKKAYSKEKAKDTKAVILYRIGECYRLTEDMKQAEDWYQKAAKAKYPEPELTLYLAQALQKQGKYDEALTEFNAYKSLKPSDKRGEQGAAECKMAQEWKDSPTRYEVQNESQLNSKQYDFSAVFADKKYESLIFTSTRDGSTGSQVDSRSGEGFSDLYITERDKKGKWSVPQLLNPEVNTEHNEGSVALNAKYNLMYFTRCENEKKEVLGCKIWQAKKMGQKWGDPELVPIPLPGDSFTVGHPAISQDDMTLLFSSDMPGGHGGKDLWYMVYEKKGKAWSAPVNLGPTVNTSRDEMFPYLHENGNLYFASNGHPGMGGLDNFMSPKTGENTWGQAENLKYPLNSEANDFGIVFEGNNDRGYLTSSRSGGKGGDDIYNFYMPPLVFAIQGEVRDVDTKAPLAGATVALVGSDGTSVEVQADNSGFFAFAEKSGSKDRFVAQNVTYKIVVSAKDYLNAKGEETTVGIEESTTFVHDFDLQSIKKNEISFPEVLYDLDKFELRPESKDSLDFLYQTLIDNPTIVIELAAHTDSRGGDGYNQTLSQKRAEACVKYLISKGIPAARMVGKGYGETKLIFSDQQISGFATEEEREAAHQRNRRTVFSVLRDDYVPVATPNKEGEGDPDGND